MVRFADHALTFHLLDDTRRAVIADLQMALDKAGRGLLLAGHKRYRIVVQLVARLAAAFTAFTALEVAFGDVFDIARLGL